MKRLMFYVFAAVICFSSCTFVKASDNSSEPVIGRIKVRGSGVMTTEKYNVPDFDKIAVAISSDVKYLVTDGEPYVEVTADDNAQEYLKFKVVNSELSIKATQERVSFNNCKIKIIVASSCLRNVDIAGSADLKIESPFKTDNFKCSIAGSGDVDIDSLEASSITFEIAGSGDIDARGINCKDIECAIAGSGDIELSGYAENASYSIAGSGDIHANALKAEKSKTSVAGSGTVYN